MVSIQPFLDRKNRSLEVVDEVSNEGVERTCLNRFPYLSEKAETVSQLKGSSGGVGSDFNILSWEEIGKKFQTPITLSRTVEIHLIRHAESEINAQKLITGSQDADLSQRGVIQAYELGRKLDDSYDAAFASSLWRSQATLLVAMTSGRISAQQVLYDPRLSERSLGVLEGQKQQSIPAYTTGDLDYAPEGGESYREVAQRTLSFLYDLANFVRNNELDKILICGHMGPMRILVGIIEEYTDSATVLRFSFPNAEVSRLRWSRLLIPEFLKSS